MILRISGGKGWLNELINQSMSDEAVYRTAPATPGLLIRRKFYYHERFTLTTTMVYLDVLKWWHKWVLWQSKDSSTHCCGLFTNKMSKCLWSSAQVNSRMTVDCHKCHNGKSLGIKWVTYWPIVHTPKVKLSRIVVRIWPNFNKLFKEYRRNVGGNAHSRGLQGFVW